MPGFGVLKSMKKFVEHDLKIIKITQLTWSSLYPNSNPIELYLLEKKEEFNPKQKKIYC